MLSTLRQWLTRQVAPKAAKAHRRPLRLETLEERHGPQPFHRRPFRRVSVHSRRALGSDLSQRASALLFGHMVNSFHVLTAGNSLYRPQDGGFATSIIAIPDLQGSYEPYGIAYGTYERVEGSYATFADNNPGETSTGVNDIGLVTLDHTIGNSTGWFGLYYNTANSFYTGYTVTTAGYPDDSSYGYYGSQMYSSTGALTGVDSGGDALDFSQSNLTTFSGDSGGPVWLEYENTPCITGVVAAGGTDSSSLSFAALITQQVCTDLQSWMAADAGTTSPPPPSDSHEKNQNLNKTTNTPDPAGNPVLATIAAQFVHEGNALALEVTATPANGFQQLTYSLNGPAGATINANTGLINWVPSPSSGQTPGNYSMTVDVHVDGSPQAAVSQTFTVNVENAVPAQTMTTLTASTASTTLGNAVTFTADVTPVYPFPMYAPTGTVTFMDGSVSLGTATLTRL